MLSKPKKVLPKSLRYTLYLSTGEKCSGESNYRVLEDKSYEVTSADSNGLVQIQVKDGRMNPEGESWKYTHLQVYTENEFGRSKYCSSQEFEDQGAGEEL